MAKTYWVSNESEILNPGERPFRSLDKALALAAKAAEECSWTCLTPPGRDNDQGNGRFLCGVLSPHGIHVREDVDGFWGEEHDVPEENFGRTKGAGPHTDWHLNVIVDRGTGYLADGDTDVFFTGPEQTDTGWDAVVDDIADGDKIVEATVRPTPHGRYSHLIGENGDYPMRWRKGYGF